VLEQARRNQTYETRRPRLLACSGNTSVSPEGIYLGEPEPTPRNPPREGPVSRPYASARTFLDYDFRP
jgi:hypothetical protein